MTTETNIPAGYMQCPCCKGECRIQVGMTRGKLHAADGPEAPEPTFEDCDECNSQGFVLDEELLDEDEDAFEDEDSDGEYDDSMDGDHGSALASAGYGDDEDYGDYGGDCGDYE